MLAVACYAVNGSLKALQKGMDFFGAVVIALVTAVGGGTARDLLLRQDVFWVRDPLYVHVGAAVATAVVLATRFARAPSRLVPITDALGLSLFAVIGAHSAQATGVAPMIAVLTGAMTGFVGGIVRDILCGEIPRVLKRDIHATAALAGAGLYVLLLHTGVGERTATSVAASAVFVVRLVEIRWGIHLPTLRMRRRAGGEREGPPAAP